MSRRKVREIVLTSFADFLNGMATAWAFAMYDSFTRLLFSDLIVSLSLAILCLSTSIGIKLKIAYDKHT